ncbi:unnamed protein product [Dicrocoelium dendriticum]|nr:unnamed protein product [Dicrocoelium dendriticum]
MSTKSRWNSVRMVGMAFSILNEANFAVKILFFLLTRVIIFVSGAVLIVCMSLVDSFWGICINESSDVKAIEVKSVHRLRCSGKRRVGCKSIEAREA